MTDVLIERELLEELRDAANEAHNEATRPYRMKFFSALVEKADAILAAPRQPEGDGLEVWGNKMGQEFLCSDPKGKIVLETIPLCRLSDAQRAIAELREVNRIQLEIATVHGAACVGIRKQRDKLAGLLRDAAQIIDTLKGDPVAAGEMLGDIDAALAEVSK